MKTQFKRFSKSTISVLLAVCLLFSCMTVGIIATDAAKTADERVGAVDDSDTLGTNTTAVKLPKATTNPGKDAGEALGAKDDSAALGADTATHNEYVGTSEYIYHGVNTNGQAVSGYENKTMSEGVIGGQRYAYYNVTGRESVGYDQLFYISKGGSYDGRYVYFTDRGGTYTDWANHDPTAYFYNSSGVVVGDV